MASEEDDSSVEGLEADEAATDIPAVRCTIIGKDVGFPRLGKTRPDEEDSWPTSNSETVDTGGQVDVAKFQEEQQSLPSETRQPFVTPEILEPPLPLENLVTAFEESNALRQNVDAMVTNVDSFGFTLVPVEPLDSKEFREIIEDSLRTENQTEPTREAVDEALAKAKKEAAVERRCLKQFFNYCASESFIELRRNSREDLEALGNFTWEVLRGKDGKIRRFVQIPFFSVRLAKKGDLVDVTVKRKVSPIAYEEFDERQRFRRFVQLINMKKIWFKEFGDPRPMSRKTGRYFKDVKEIEELAKDDSDEGEASEVLHYSIRALRGAYGLPRWVGNILSVRGSRLSEEVNFFYFNNKAIPPLMIFVENGRLQDGATERLAEFFEEVKGDTKKFWKVCLLEGESADDARRRGVSWTGQPRFKVVKLFSEQLKDALFQKYDERNRDKIGESMRIPRLLRGDTKDFNRATAQSAKAFAEEQVFEPERDRFDAWINRIIGPEIGMKYWEFKSLSPIVRDPFSLTEMVEKLVKAAVLTPEEGRQIAEDIFNRAFKKIEDEWVKQPIAISLAGVVKREDLLDASGVTPPSAAIRKEFSDVLGLGEPGEPIDHEATINRLTEIRNELVSVTVEPDED